MILFCTLTIVQPCNCLRSRLRFLKFNYKPRKFSNETESGYHEYYNLGIVYYHKPSMDQAYLVGLNCTASNYYWPQHNCWQGFGDQGLACVAQGKENYGSITAPEVPRGRSMGFHKAEKARSQIDLIWLYSRKPANL